MKSKSINIVQLSDSHLFSESSGKLLGLNTLDSLQWVVERVEEEQPDVDLILATGDIAQEPCIESYTAFQQEVAKLAAPVYWVLGNHDAHEPMQKVVGDANRISPCVVDFQTWRIILLNSSVEGEVPGYLSPEQLQYLKQQLASAGDKHIMLCFHHHPVPMNSRWLDAQMIGNANELFAITDQFTNIRLMVWGHVHQESDQLRNGVRLLSTPSTCAQFQQGSVDFSVDGLAPGYRWIECYDDGKIDTGVSRVEGVSFQVDYSVKGY